LFSIDLPRQVTFSAKKSAELGLSMVERLPPNLGTNGDCAWHASINYQFIVDVKRKGAFRAGSSLMQYVEYLPDTKPKPPSTLRLLAYAENTPILGPDVDPFGWHVSPDIEIRGNIFKTRSVTAKCSLAIAKPLQYTRGTVLPLILEIRSVDKQALDLFSGSKSPCIQLRRLLKAEHAAFQLIGSKGWVATNFKSTEDNMAVATATWGPPEVLDASEDFKRIMHGELSIPKDLDPSFKFGNFVLKYAIEMYPFKAAGFVPDSENRLMNAEVVIATNYARGARPRAYLPPQYDATHG